MLGALISALAMSLLAGQSAGATPSENGNAEALVPVLIKFHSNVNAADIDDAVHGNGGTVTSDLRQIRTKVIHVPANARDRILAAYARHPAVERATPAIKLSRAGTPTDPDYTQQWALPKIAWDQAYGTLAISGHATIAVLDTGIDATHADLAGRMVAGASFTGGDPNSDPNGHGTALAGIAAANVGDGIGMAGVAYAGTDVSSVQVLQADGTGYDSDVVAGVLWAADHGASVILMGFSSADYSAALADALAYAWGRGAVLVSATGNDGSSTPTYPAGMANVIGVGATDRDDVLAASSNTAGVSVAAPGVGIYATTPGGGHGAFTGTSAAAAETAGLAALLVASGKGNADVSNQIRGTVDPISGAQFGRINVYGALSSVAASQPAPGPGPTPTPGPSPTYVAAAAQFAIQAGAAATVNEGNSGTTSVVFDVQLSGSGSGDCTIANPCRVDFAISPGPSPSAAPGPGPACAAGNDYIASSGTLTFGNGNQTQPITVTVCSDTLVEADERFTATLSNARGAQGISIKSNNASATATIVDDDGATISINDIAATEGNSGTKTFTFTVTLSAALGHKVTVDYATAAGPTNPATAGSCGSVGMDYQSTSATATINNGTTATISVVVCGDTTSEPDETFVINLSNPLGATIADAEALGTIQNDDNVAPTIAVANPAAAVNEGATALNTGTYNDANAGDTVAITASIGTVTKTGTSSGTWSWSFATSDGPAQGQTVSITANDGHGGVATTSFSLTVNNVAPSATFNAPPAVAEGDPIELSLSGSSDPSSADTAAGFQYAFDCGSGYGAFGTSNSTSCPTNDNGTRTVKGQIKDKDGSSSEYSAFVLIANVPPTATLANNGPVDEGSAVTVSFSAQFDPSSVDTAAGFHYVFSCTNGDVSGTYAASGTASSTTCTFSDNGPYTVKGRIIDKDGGSSTYLNTVTVRNVAPTATLSNNGPASEGLAATISFSGQSDPGSADTAAGFHYAYSCTNGDLSAATYAGSGTSGSTSCTFDDGPATQTVKARIIDKDGGFSEYTTDVMVTNVAPTATFNVPASLDEGSSIALSVGAATDPSSADTGAGFQYAFDCGSGYGSYGATSTASCPTSDSGTRAVKAKLKDKDGGETEYTASVTVNNVAPTATLANNGPVDEGSAVTVSFSAQLDPSSVDTAAGFHYVFSCTNGDVSGTYAASGTASSTTCTFSDNGTYTVKGRIIDKDGGSSTYLNTVAVTNVAPSVNAGADGTSNEGSAFSQAGSFTDPGADTWTATVNYGDGSGSSALGLTGKTFTLGHTYADNGSFTITVTVTDDDGGIGSATLLVTVNNVAPTAALNAPTDVNEGSAIAISLTDASDPSSADTAAGFQYAFDCGSGYGAFGTSNSTSCPTNDNGTRTVKGQIKDKDGGYTEYTATVTVKNIAPTASIDGAPATSLEGDAIALTSTVTDPSSADAVAGFTYAWSATKNGTSYASGTAASFAFTPNDDGTYVVTLSVTDKDGGTGADSKTIAVTNVAPGVNAGADGTSNEGSAFSQAGSFTDPGADTWTATVNYGDGSGSSALGLTGKTFTLGHTYADNGSFTITVTVTDDDGGIGSDTVLVTVNNVSPTAALSNNGPINEGSSATVSFSAQSDPSPVDTAAGFHYVFSCTNGDLSGATYAASGASASTSCAFADNGSYPVKARIIDKDGGFSEYTTTVVVNNVAPANVSLSPSATTLNENATTTLSGSFTDPGSADTHAVVISWGDGSSNTTLNLAAGVLTFSATHQYLDDNPPGTASDLNAITATVTDQDSATASGSTSVRLNNVAPVITAVTGPLNPLAKPGTATIAATFTDIGSQDQHTCRFSWDDGAAADTTVTAAGTGNGSCSATHTYNSAGVSTVTVTVTDDDSGSAVKTWEFVVVYDPNAGFVTGGGWINSFAGSFTADPTLAGKANFGFVSKYQKGASTPTGETEFQFQTGNFDFHSDVYSVLVISTFKAQYKGSGSVNGVAGYDFILTAYDGDIPGGGGVDKFRIKITKHSTGAVVYDNSLGSSDDMDTANPEALGGGSIVVHAVK